MFDQLQLRVWKALEANGGCDGQAQCGGMGMITLDVDIKHEAFGRAFICICRREQALMNQMNNSIESDAIPDDSYNVTWQDFDNLPYAAMPLKYAAQLVTSGSLFDEAKKRDRVGMLLYGTTGCGKTTLVSLVYREFVAKGRSVGWWNARAFVKRVQSTYASDYQGPSYEQIINAVSRLDLLVLDDLGSPTFNDTYSDDHIEILLRVLNYREAHHLPTMGTSNCGETQLRTQFGPRNYSRLHGLMAFVYMNGADFRMGELVKQEVRR